MPYVCAACRHIAPVFSLLCVECGSWNTLRSQDVRTAEPQALPDLGRRPVPRIPTGIPPLDDLLGGGFAPGSSVLLIGPRGSGKSTLAMHLLKKMKLPALYVAAEESSRRLEQRAGRLRLRAPDVFVLFETNVGNIVPHLDAVKALVVDPIDEVYTERSDALAGSSTQIRKCAFILRRLAIEKNLLLLLIAETTEGRRGGGAALLAHAMDVVLQIDVEGRSRRRFLSARKNRFGVTEVRCGLSLRRSGPAFFRSGP